MKLATLSDGSPDGRLVIVARDHSHFVQAVAARTLQEALERWTEVEPLLQRAYDELNAGSAPGANPFVASEMAAPLPRAWQWLDGSAYESHGDLMQKVFDMDPIPRDRPLMYQGVSDTFYGGTDDVPFPNETDGIDFEGEFGVIVDEVPMGISADDAMKHIRLIVQINDWSLRKIAPVEMKTGFGWVQAKPPCSVAPVAVTPDELGDAWRDGRPALPLNVAWNGKKFGSPDGYAMGFGFHELIAHAAHSRRLVAGTVIGSGTVSNTNFREVGSSCIAERRGIELLDTGAASTPFMRFGDTVRMEASLADGSPLFGVIEQRVVRG